MFIKQKEFPMKNIPDVLVAEMRRGMDAKRLSRPEQVEWFKWLRYYLDFCFKYQHSTRIRGQPLHCIKLLDNVKGYQPPFDAKIKG
jgi:hypothetical protein